MSDRITPEDLMRYLDGERSVEEREREAPGGRSGMIEAHTPRCRGCGTPVGRRDRCFNCGARWPQLNGEEIRAHNRLCVLLFALFVAIAVTVGWLSLRVASHPGSEEASSRSHISTSNRFAGVTDLHTKEEERPFPDDELRRPVRASRRALLHPHEAQTGTLCP